MKKKPEVDDWVLSEFAKAGHMYSYKVVRVEEDLRYKSGYVVYTTPDKGSPPLPPIDATWFYGDINNDSDVDALRCPSSRSCCSGSCEDSGC